MSKINYKILCKKCKKYFKPEKNKTSNFGYCKDCVFLPGKCHFINENGYPCSNDAEFASYCVEHFLKVPISKLTNKIKNI